MVASRTEAQAAVRNGRVSVRGRPADKPSSLVDDADPVELLGPPRRYVSRGGDKLEAALGRFRVDPAGRSCLDAGASTGGFTDCLLRRGARHVVAVDVGYGQLAWTIRTDDRVTVLERTNVRELSPGHLPYAPDLVVADLSFISLGLAVDPLSRVAAEGADLVLLVKPQFEAGPREVGRGGVVRDPEVWRRAIDGVVAACASAGSAPRAVMASPLAGAAGNVEFLLHATKGGDAEPRPDVDGAIDEGRRIGGNA